MYLEKLKMLVPEAMDYLNLLPECALNEQVLKAWETGGLMEKEWSNIIVHQVVEAAVVNALCWEQEIGERLACEHASLHGLVQSALVHDAYKRRERENANAVDGAAKAYDDAVEGSSSFLLNIGFDPEIVQLTERLGHLSLKHMLGSDVTLADCVVHYADDIVAGNDIVSHSERMDYLDNRARPGEPYEKLNKAGKKIFHGRGYFQIQREVGQSIEIQLAGLVGCEPAKALPYYLKEKIGINL